MAQQPGFPEQLGTMYKRMALDCIVDMAYAVSMDFSQRLDLYHNVSSETAIKLAKLHGEYGYNANFPNREIRASLYRPIFGELGSDWQGGGNGSPFQTSRLHVLAAAVALAENYTSTPQIGEDSLIAAVRSASDSFIIQMRTLEGAGFTQTDSRTKEIFKTSEEILKDKEVAGRFSVDPPTDPAWPLGPKDGNGAILVQQITSLLPDIPGGQITIADFSRMKLMADTGCRSIIGILDPDFETDKDKLLQVNAHLNAWARELGMVGGTMPQ
jgi:hypothetical protein